jgi:tetratricopeptide (TPR) repeat protein
MLEQGAALLAGGRFHEALGVFSQVLRQEPGSLPARIGLARAFAGTGDGLTAAAWLSDAARIAPGSPEPVQLLADLLLSQKQFAQALPLYLRLLGELHARTAANLLHGGYCHELAGSIDQAVALYREALQVRPDFMEAQVDLAGVLWRVGDFEGALRHAQRACALAPDHPFAVRILGTALLNLNRVEEAERHLRRALELRPGFALAELDLAFALLLDGRYEEGWRWYECRWHDTDRLRRPAFFRPEREWAGPAQPIAGGSIAVYAEQGLGDVIQFARYIPRLQALGAKVVCIVQPELVPLVEASFDGVECLAPGRDLQVHSHVALLDLPGRFGTRLADVPHQVPYLRVPPEAHAAWRDRMRPWADRTRIGIAWSGSMQQVNNRNRAVPLSLLLPLVQRAGVQGFSLQKGEAGEATDVAVATSGLVDFTAHWDDFAESAAQIEQLDLVVTVDTGVAHLAGALGKPVWILLGPNADWRWLLEREDSPWYPTARLFRRGFDETREQQVLRVAAALEMFLAA